MAFTFARAAFVIVVANVEIASGCSASTDTESESSDVTTSVTGGTAGSTYVTGRCSSAIERRARETSGSRGPHARPLA